MLRRFIARLRAAGGVQPGPVGGVRYALNRYGRLGVW